MQIILAAVEPELADAWEQFCGDLPGVSIHRGSILDVECDAVVSPANSFGFMDGGLPSRLTLIADRCSQASVDAKGEVLRHSRTGNYPAHVQSQWHHAEHG